MNEWKCPKCGHMNTFGIVLCNCGYKDKTGLSAVAEPSSLPSPDVAVGKPRVKRTNAVRQKTGNAPRKRGPSFRNEYGRLLSGPRSSIFQSWFKLSTWKEGYARWTLLLVLGIFCLRGTTDGLWLLGYTAIALARRWEAHKRIGVKFILGKEKGQSLWDYGVGRTIMDIILPSILTGDRLELSHVIVPVTCALLYGLHLYVGIVCLFDAINAAFTARVLTVLNEPVAHLLPYWRSYQATAEQLISHGYASRIPLVSHIYAVLGLSSLGYFLYMLFHFFVRTPLEDWYNFKSEQSKDFRTPFARGVIRFLCRRNPSRWLVFSVVSVLLALFIYAFVRLPLCFPGEPHPRHGKYIWMYSYAYTDNIGLFTPIYYLVPVVNMFFIGLTAVFEPFYRGGLYVIRLCKK